MNYWNYRVIKGQEDNVIDFTIAEVFYDDNELPVAWVECSKNTFISDKYEELKDTINLLSKAFDKPILLVEGDKLIELK